MIFGVPRRHRITLLLLVWFFVAPGIASALVPEEVLVIANRNVPASTALADFYMEKRRIPSRNLVRIAMADKETCSREAYETQALPPIKRYLKDHPDIRALVTLYGVPLKILAPPYSNAERAEIKRLNQEIERLRKQAANTRDADKKKDRDTQLKTLQKELTDYKRSLDRTASFDSEVSLALHEPYDIKAWQPNPFYYYTNRGKITQIPRAKVMMVSRLDAASPDIVRRIITDSMEAERDGLSGTAYFDARWKDPGDKKTTGYARYDQAIHEAAAFHKKHQLLPVVLDDEERLFQKGEAPNAALYCGWYSLSNYIDAFEWTKGSVGFHIASGECVTLKRFNHGGWCKNMLDNGIAATVGPVAEPYVEAFPLPNLFFIFLTEGHLTLVESYMVSLPFLSWKMVLIGDPLYRVNLKKPAP